MRETKAFPFDFFHFDFLAMGSPCSLSLYADDIIEANVIAEAAINEIQRIEAKYSRYRPQSLLGDINCVAAVGGRLCVDDETALLIDHAIQAYVTSGGLFDVTSGRLREIWNDAITAIPDRADIAALLVCVGLDKLVWQRPQLTFNCPGLELDLGGLAKEYAADRAVSVCKSMGVQHGLVNLGGDIAIIGAHPDGAPWRIGICDPSGITDAIATLFAASGAVATSGDYERYFEIDGQRFSHLLNPQTGWPVEGLPSVTVIAETCLSAGTASTIAALKGAAGAEWLRQTGAAHLTVQRSGKMGGSILLDQPQPSSTSRRCGIAT